MDRRRDGGSWGFEMGHVEGVSSLGMIKARLGSVSFSGVEMAGLGNCGEVGNVSVLEEEELSPSRRETGIGSSKVG